MTSDDEVEVLAGHGAEQRAHEVQEAHMHRLVEHRALQRFETLSGSRLNKCVNSPTEA